jgi:hypothetical protein
MKKLCSISLALMATMYLASTVLASPIPLYTDQVTKLKYTNFEQLIDNQTSGPGAGVISEGDQFQGVLTVTTVTDVSSSQGATLWDNGGSDELTGTFQLTVTGVYDSNGDPTTLSTDVAPSSPVTVTFGLTSNNDHISLYHDSTADYSANTDPGILSSSAAMARDIANAEDGNLWFEVLGQDYLGGFNYSYFDSTNYNWANLTTNNTGYTILKELWPSILGYPAPSSMLSQIYFEDKIKYIDPTNPGANANAAYAGWQYSSEDPLYLHAVPEPATMTLFGLGLLFGGASIKRRRNSLK